MITSTKMPNFWVVKFHATHLNRNPGAMPIFSTTVFCQFSGPIYSSSPSFGNNPRREKMLANIRGFTYRWQGTIYLHLKQLLLREMKVWFLWMKLHLLQDRIFCPGLHQGLCDALVHSKREHVAWHPLNKWSSLCICCSPKWWCSNSKVKIVSPTTSRKVPCLVLKLAILTGYPCHFLWNFGGWRE